MSIEIEFPLEFVVNGTPVSQQAKRRASIEEWKQRVKDASRAALPAGHFVTDSRVSVTMFYFPEGEMQGDIDNIVKPILDALRKHIYGDDGQVERIWVQKFERASAAEISSPSPVLADAIQREKPLLYVRLSDDPSEALSHVFTP